jgi:FkbM family methyltransferase
MPAILDRFGIYRGRYLVHLRNNLCVELRAAHGDRSGFYEVLIRGDYTNFGQKISLGDTVVDVGANVGCFAMLAAQMVGPTGRVIAIEPEEDTFAQLIRNIELNSLRNVIPYKLSLGNREGDVTFYTGASSLASSIHRSSKHTEKQVVPMTTLETLFRREGISECDYMKMDCEGCEYEIFDAITPEFAERIKQVSLEVHRIPGREPAEIHQRLRELGFHEISNERVYYYRR